MILWHKPFNNVVRSHEALFTGFMVGAIFGICVILLSPVTISEGAFAKPIEVCSTVPNITHVRYSHTGNVISVLCKDGKSFSG